jgi:predicted transcriptional regulator
MASTTESTAFGTPTRLLVRQNAPETSRQAAKTLDTKTDERIAYELISNSSGLTVKEIAVKMGKQTNQVSGRITSLLRKGLVIDSGQRRANSRVIITPTLTTPQQAS